MNTFISFGKYKGQLLSVVAQDSNYTFWLIQQEWFKKRFPSAYDFLLTSTLEDPSTKNIPQKRPSKESALSMFKRHQFIDATAHLRNIHIASEYKTGRLIVFSHIKSNNLVFCPFCGLTHAEEDSNGIAIIPKCFLDKNHFNYVEGSSYYRWKYIVVKIKELVPDFILHKVAMWESELSQLKATGKSYCPSANSLGISIANSAAYYNTIVLRSGGIPGDLTYGSLKKKRDKLLSIQNPTKLTVVDTMKSILKDPNLQQSFVYCISNEEGHVKIGYTSQDINKRLKQLLTSSSGSLKLEFWLFGDKLKEAELHTRMEHFHINREWFHGDSISEIKQILFESSVPYYERWHWVMIDLIGYRQKYGESVCFKFDGNGFCVEDIETKNRLGKKHSSKKLEEDGV